jgi:HK97 family phage prohead protease
MSWPLARTKGATLTVREDSDGISFEADLPDTQDARDVVQLARAGVISSMSFSFNYSPGGYRTSTKNGETYLHVTRIARIHELSVVCEPAYQATSVSARGRQLAEVRARAARARQDNPPVGSHGRIRARAVDLYRPDSPHSWVRDMATVSADERHTHAAVMRGSRGALAAPGEGIPDPTHGSADVTPASV